MTILEKTIKACPKCGCTKNGLVYWLGDNCICRKCIRYNSKKRVAKKIATGQIARPGMRRTQGIQNNPGKIPKIQFQPGDFVKDPSGQWWVILAAYRRIENPGEWLFVIEERDSNGQTKMTFMSLACELLSLQEGKGSIHGNGKIFPNPINQWVDVNKICGLWDVYQHGSRTIGIPTKELLKWERGSSETINAEFTQNKTGTAAEVLKEMPVEFVQFLDGKEPTKRQARKFLKTLEA